MEAFLLRAPQSLEGKRNSAKPLRAACPLAAARDFSVVCLVTQPILSCDGIRMAFDYSTGHNCLAFITCVLNRRLFPYMLVSSNNFRLMVLDLCALLLAFAIASYERAPDFHSDG